MRCEQICRYANIALTVVKGRKAEEEEFLYINNYISISYIVYLSSFTDFLQSYHSKIVLQFWHIEILFSWKTWMFQKHFVFLHHRNKCRTLKTVDCLWAEIDEFDACIKDI